ncbi:Protein of unknown function [Gryllus bimaculatus]|nr:Protein of unknown function [Gryllus bimaculatus]
MDIIALEENQMLLELLKKVCGIYHQNFTDLSFYSAAADDDDAFTYVYLITKRLFLPAAFERGIPPIELMAEQHRLYKRRRQNKGMEDLVEKRRESMIQCQETMGQLAKGEMDALTHPKCRNMGKVKLWRGGPPSHAAVDWRQLFPWQPRPENIVRSVLVSKEKWKAMVVFSAQIIKKLKLEEQGEPSAKNISAVADTERSESRQRKTREGKVESGVERRGCSTRERLGREHMRRAGGEGSVGGAAGARFRPGAPPTASSPRPSPRPHRLAVAYQTPGGRAARAVTAAMLGLASGCSGPRRRRPRAWHERARSWLRSVAWRRALACKRGRALAAPLAPVVPSPRRFLRVPPGRPLHPSRSLPPRRHRLRRRSAPHGQLLTQKSSRFPPAAEDEGEDGD